MKINNFFKRITLHPDIVFQRAIFFHKKYRLAKDKKNFFLMILFGRIANYYSRKYNLELYGNLGKDIKIWHGNIVINSNAIIGNNVQFHGNNCVGNNNNSKAPQIGNNVEIGYGAIIIGDIYIADNVKVGANSLVNKSIEKEGAVVVGSPAKIIK